MLLLFFRFGRARVRVALSCVRFTLSMPLSAALPIHSPIQPLCNT
jgi:hypothetical protein